MRLLRDYKGSAIHPTEERLAHILEHPEMAGLEQAIEKTLAEPEWVIQSMSDNQVHLYYRSYRTTRMGRKLLCVVVKVRAVDPFVLTAYLTDKFKRGDILWQVKS